MMMKKICQLYMPAFYRSFGIDSINMVTALLPYLKKEFSGIYLIGLWEDGGYDNGFDVVDYVVNPKFGAQYQLEELIRQAHERLMMVGVDVVPNHVSDKNILAKNCLRGTPGYEDALYVVLKEEAERLTKAGVPSFFGELAYSDFGDKYVRSSFADYHQLNLNWNSPMVKEYFKEVFQKLKRLGISFARVDCGMMLMEDVTKADPQNIMAVFNPADSIAAIREVAGGMKLFFEWFDLSPSSLDLFNDLPECYALDCSFVLTGKQNLKWNHKKLIPLLGGHDQKTVADRGIDVESVIKKLEESGAEYGFLDIQTLLETKSEPEIMPGDGLYDADLYNVNQRYRARRPIWPIIEEFKKRGSQ